MTLHPVYNSSFDLGLYIVLLFVYFEFVLCQLVRVRIVGISPCTRGVEEIIIMEASVTNYNTTVDLAYKFSLQVTTWIVTT